MFEKDVGMQSFVISDIDLAPSRYCLWSWEYPVHALRYSFGVFWNKLLLLACFVVIKYALFISILKLQCLMNVHGYDYLQDYRRPFSSCKPNKEWPHIGLPCCNESEKEIVLWNG